jgi:hypothetical protein
VRIHSSLRVTLAIERQSHGSGWDPEELIG